MEIEITKEKENPFFKRKELLLNIKHPNEATPSKTQIIKKLAEKYSIPENQISVDYIFTTKGVAVSKAKVRIYETQVSEAK